MAFDKKHRPAPERPSSSDPTSVRLFGAHAVEAALRNPIRQVNRLLLTDNAERRLADILSQRSVRQQRVAPRDLDRLLGPDTVHQGVLLEAEPLPEPTLLQLADRARAEGPLVVLDQVTDPHNVGAILRSAAAFGASGLVMPRRHSPPLSGVLAKSASGALELVPISLVPNLARALGELGEAGVDRVGLDGEAPLLIEDQSFKGAVAFVLGSEGRGLRRLTRELCDRLCRIHTRGPIGSLNVSNAAAVALHAASLQRRDAAG
jgi:23S rRNA (guanosine2251-2'-O)-methyltransferase